MKIVQHFACLGLGLACLLSAAIAQERATTPVIYTTDLFHPAADPDDHFDLACLYAIPEADLRAIVLDQGDRQVQRPGFTPVWQLNYLTGRHVPAAIGLRDKLKTPDDPGLDQPAEFQNGVHLILQTLRSAREKVAMIFVGSARDIVAAFNRRPDLFREKVRSIHGFIGEANHPTHLEANVRHDPQAFVRLMRADVPFFWIPCFDGGPRTNLGHASYWRIEHGDVLARAPEQLLRYFLYMRRRPTDDPIAYLAQATSVADTEALMRGERNLWCAALLGLAVGVPILHAGREVVGFSRVEAVVDDNGIVGYGRTPGARAVMRFELKEQAVFAGAATRATARLLESFPVRPSP